MANEKQHAHRLLDQLEPGQLAAVVHLASGDDEPAIALVVFGAR